MASASEDIKDFLVDDGVAYFIGDDPMNPSNLEYGISIGFTPDEPQKVITLRGVTAYREFHTLDNQQARRESVQLLLRADNFPAGWNFCNDLLQMILGWGKRYDLTHSYCYQSFTLINGINELGLDEHRLAQFSFSFFALRYKY